ncbi:MAG: histidinol-phosphate transaminase [Gammaproteobacteria bacterium]|nr:histidinol-phosphate transaminase [Gammaproteobacteria bacterium]
MSTSPPADPQTLAARWIRPEIRQLAAYHVPDARGLIKLDAMENPYPLPLQLLAPWQARLASAELNRYPDPAAATLVNTLTQVFAVPDGQRLLLGNGSDELIQLIMMSVLGPGRSVLAPEPSFSMYRMIAGFVGLAYHGVALNPKGFELDVDAMLAAIDRHQPAVVFLSYPNNPTGNLFDRDAVLQIVRRAPGLVVVDEAYHAFAGGASLLSDLPQHSNLLVLRTLSKMGLAGLRLGILAGAPPWLDQINKIRLPYNINVLTQLSAEFALQHYAVFRQQTDRICSDREALLTALRALPGLQVYPSQANFILFRTPRGRAPVLFAALKARGVLIKSLDGSHPQLHDCLRVTIGTPDENLTFIAALGQALDEPLDQPLDGAAVL